MKDDNVNKNIVKKTKKRSIKKKMEDDQTIFNEDKTKTKRKLIRKKIHENEKDNTESYGLELDSLNTTKKTKNRQCFTLIEVIVMLIIVMLISCTCSAIFVYNNYEKISSTAINKSKETDLSEFISSYNHILDSYVNEVDKSKLIESAIKGMYSYLDDGYSQYIDPELNESLQESLEGKYEGIGIEITMNENDEVYISRVFSDTPADKAGLKANDILIEIDGESLEDKTQSDVADYIRNNTEKSKFDIKYKREDKINTVTIERKEVFIEQVTSKEYDKVGYIQIETFSSTIAEQVKNKINKFSPEVNTLIIDVRSNSGGYLNAAYDTSSLFVGKNKVVYQLKDKEGNITKKMCKEEPIKQYKKIIVLTNEYSASASEILTLALKENLNAISVGKTTYGKGTVQETEQLKSGAMVKYTSAYWLSPNGNSINEKGIAPDYDVDYKNENDRDEQLEKALEIANE